MKDDLHFLRLWDLYSPLLTPNQREITDLYFNYDLSLGEIAEQKGVSRQSVSDCLQTCRKQLEKYEEKLKFSQALHELSLEYSAYMTETARWIAQMREKRADLAQELGDFQVKLDSIQQEFGSQKTDLGEGNEIVGRAFRAEE